MWALQILRYPGMSLCDGSFNCWIRRGIIMAVLANCGMAPTPPCLTWSYLEIVIILLIIIHH